MAANDGLLAYCIVPAGTRPPASLRGVDDAPVIDVVAGEHAVWASAARHRPEPSVERIRRHNDVIDAASDARLTPVPLRFGQWLPDEATLRRDVARSADTWRAKLAEFAGACEMGVRAAGPPAAAPAAPAQDVQQPRGQGGRAYLERLARQHASRADRRAHAARVAAVLRSQLGALISAEHVADAAAGAVVIAHLVPRAAVADYRARAAALRAARPELQLVFTGPWAPYSFVP